MDRKFQKRLNKSGVDKTTIAVLQKECILQESTLKLLTPNDLELLRSKHHVTMGQFVILRTIHGELVAGERTQPRPPPSQERTSWSRTRSSDEDEMEEDGFEIVRMEDVPVEMRGEAASRPASAGSQKRGRRNKNIRGGGNSARDVMGENMDKVVRREKKLQNVARASEDVMSAAEEYSKLTTLLAQKQKRGLLGSRKSYSSSAVESSGSDRSSRGQDPDHNHHHAADRSSFPSQPSKNHVQIGRDMTDNGSSIRQRRRSNMDRGIEETTENDRIDKEDVASDNCCTIL